jgi:Fe-S cluster assembly protein SufD
MGKPHGFGTPSAMPQVLPEKDLYRAGFSQLEQAAAPPWLKRLRKAALARFDQLGFPTARNEEWRFTSVAPLLHVPFKLASATAGVDAAAVAPHTFAGAIQLVFVNGHFLGELSALSGLPAGVTVTSLAAALQGAPESLEAHLARYARSEDHPFIALNTAFVQDGAFIAIPRGVSLDRPVHVVFVSTATCEPTVSYPRVLVVTGISSRLTLVESYVGLERDVYFTNAVTEVVLGANSRIDHYKLVRESGAAFHVGALQVHLTRSSSFTSHAVTLGGRWVRNEARAVLDAEGCECTLNGLYLAADKQHVDNHTVIDHAKPHCASHELYKGILDGHAHGVFHGKIYVRQDAQKTDAKQTNQTLLLSADAVIDTKPQLEIFADDVKCTHGATVGQLDAEALFYLRARGIGLEAARSLLTYAFANEVVAGIQVEPVRARLEESLLARQQLPLGPQIEEIA